MMRRSHLTVVTLAIILSAGAPPHAQAQIVSDAAGTIDLKLYPFFDTGPVWSAEESKDIWGPIEGQHEVIPVGLSNVSASIDGSGYYSAGGLSTFDYEYIPIGVSEARFNFHAFADSLDAGDGAGGKSSLNMQITFSQPVYYRFEADVIDAPVLYEVSFNGQKAEAWYSAMGEYGGSFPPTFHYDNPMPDGWSTYLDEGVLPAGTYDLSVAAYASLHRYGIGISSEGAASLYIQLLGDTDMNGYVGIEDLNAVLNNWNAQVQSDNSQSGDLNGDGFIGIADLNRVLSNWNADSRPLPVPEPTTAWLLIALGPALTRRTLRRRPRTGSPLNPPRRQPTQRQPNRNGDDSSQYSGPK